MATTTNYSWETPDDTDLVKDGAAAIRTLGSSIDTTTKALNPSTTLGDIEYRSSTANTNTRLGIGTTGQVLSVSGGVPAWTTPASSTPTFVGASVYNSANQNTSTATYTLLNFDSEYFDTDGFHSTTTNSSRMTIPSGKAGKYLVSGVCAWASNATGLRIVELRKNAGILTYFNTYPFTGDNVVVTMSFIVDCAVGDYLDFRAYQSSGGTLAVAGGISTIFQVSLLGA